MNKREELARQAFKEGYNCSQAMVAAFSDLMEMDKKTALRLASSFGGGMGRMREVCGAVTGMFMVVGICTDMTMRKIMRVKKILTHLCRNLQINLKRKQALLYAENF